MLTTKSLHVDITPHIRRFFRSKKGGGLFEKFMGASAMCQQNKKHCILCSISNDRRDVRIFSESDQSCSCLLMMPSLVLYFFPQLPSETGGRVWSTEDQSTVSRHSRQQWCYTLFHHHFFFKSNCFTNNSSAALLRQIKGEGMKGGGSHVLWLFDRRQDPIGWKVHVKIMVV